MNLPSRAADFDFRAPRAATPRLGVVIAYRETLLRKAYKDCELLDISRSGIGIVCKWHVADIGEKVELNVKHGVEIFPVRGYIANKMLHPTGYKYGVTFIKAPTRLDHLIDLFLAEYVERNALPDTSNVEAAWSLRETRFGMQDAHIHVRRLDIHAPFTVCQVGDISRSGVGFFGPQALGTEVPFDVLIEISDNVTVAASICYMRRRPGGYYYGARYTKIPLEFVEFLETLDDVLGDPSGSGGPGSGLV